MSTSSPAASTCAFRAARGSHCPDPSDQHDIARPRIGFFGVIDERLDRDLLSRVADAMSRLAVRDGRPGCEDPTTLTCRRSRTSTISGPKSYEDLPAYIAGWDVAMLPFARNEATRFISPTKTPEYLAAGKPVVSTSIARRRAALR